MVHRETAKHPNELFGPTRDFRSRAFSLDAETFIPLPPWLTRDLRSDHAGEAGAVAMYRGILAVSPCEDVRTFASEHVKTESNHLRLLESILPTCPEPTWRVWLRSSQVQVRGIFSLRESKPPRWPTGTAQCQLYDCTSSQVG